MQVLIAKIVASYNPAHGQPEKTAPSGNSGKSRPIGWFFTPVLGPLLSNRWLTGIFLGFGLTQLILVATGLTGWQCPIRSTIGTTCPGCGLTTAMALLVKGRWTAAVEMHAFAPFFLMVLALVAAAITLPRQYLVKLSTTVSLLERKTGITAITILGLILYWLLRSFIF